MQEAPQAAEPDLPASPTGSGLRTALSVVLAAMLFAGAWVRFNPQLAAMAPWLAGPAAVVADELAQPGRVHGLVEVGLLPASAGPEAVAAMGLATGEAASLTQALQRGQLRLVRLPLFDAQAPDDAGAGGLAPVRSVEVSSGGYTRLVALTRHPAVVLLPIARVGTVSFRATGAAAVIGALTLTGPVRLPTLEPGQLLQVGVVAQ